MRAHTTIVIVSKSVPDQRPSRKVGIWQFADSDFSGLGTRVVMGLTTGLTTRPVLHLFVTHSLQLRQAQKISGQSAVASGNYVQLYQYCLSDQ